jgi:1-deoxy-D-xylulose-5-phosphate reductoisomerase
MQKNISILGSTGSIVQHAGCVRSNPERFRVVALSCGKNLALVKEQIHEFKPKRVSLQKEADAKVLKEALGREGPVVLFGEEEAVAVASTKEAEMVVSAMVGATGLVPTLKAIEAGKIVALANKETMVIAGELINRAALRSGAHFFPSTASTTPSFSPKAIAQRCAGSSHRLEGCSVRNDGRASRRYR